MSSTRIQCTSCESEYKVVEIVTDFTISFCPYCGSDSDTEVDDE